MAKTHSFAVTGPPKIDDMITEHLPKYTGTIEAVREGYFFIRIGSYRSPIFAHHTAFEEIEIGYAEVSQVVYFLIRFNRRGPVGVSVHLKPSGWNSTSLELLESGSSDLVA